MIVSQSDMQRCKTSDGAAVFVGEGLPTVPPNITEPQGAAGVAMAAVMLSGKRQKDKAVGSDLEKVSVEEVSSPWFPLQDWFN